MPDAHLSVTQQFSIRQVLNPHPLTVTPDTTVAAVIERMGRVAGQTCVLAKRGVTSLSAQVEPSQPNPSQFEIPQFEDDCHYALIEIDQHLLGIVTETEIMQLMANGLDIEAVAIATVMSRPVVTLKQSEARSIFTVLTLMNHHQVYVLPLLDEAGNVVGTISQTTLQQSIQSLNLLKLKRVRDVMRPYVITAKSTETLLDLTQRMSQQQVDGVVVTQGQRTRLQTTQHPTQSAPNPSQGIPVGIVTRRDIIQCHALGISLADTLAQDVMNTSQVWVDSHDSLWEAHQHMQRTHMSLLGVMNDAGELAGTMNLASVLQQLDPVELLTELERLQPIYEAQTATLNTMSQELHHCDQALQAEVTEHQRLESRLHQTQQMMEEKVGIQAAHIVQTEDVLSQETHQRRDAQAQLEQFFILTPSLLCIAGFDGYFKRLNASFAETLGYDTSELQARPFIHFVHPDDRSATQAEVERLAAGGRSLAFENRYRCKDGRYRWLSWNATANLDDHIIYAAIRDITDQKQLEDTLRRESHFIAAVLDTVRALVVVLDHLGRIVRFNRTCETISGYSAAEVQGYQIWDVLIPPEERAEIHRHFQELKHGQGYNQHESSWVRKNGQRTLIHWSNTTLKNAAGKVEYIIGTGIDVTNQRRTERNLMRQYQQGQLLGEITRKIRESLEIDDILQTTVNEVRQLLGCDRVLILKADSEDVGIIIQESMAEEDVASLLHQQVSGLKVMHCRDRNLPQACVFDSLKSAPCSLYSCQFLQQYGVHSCIEVAISIGNQFWGLITVLQCDRSRHWEQFEIDLVQHLANQLGVAISQAQLLDNLEALVEQRTAQLKKTNRLLHQEIQERIKTETALRESQQQLSGILDNADEAIISIDQDQHIVLYNQGAEHIFGYTAEEALGQSLAILLPDTFRASHRRHVKNFAASVDTSRRMAERRRDVFGRRKNGEEFPAEASISKLYTKTGYLFTVMLRDITQRRRSEAALQRSEEQLRLTTDAIPALICYVDHEQRYRFLNQTFSDWFQRPVNELCDRYVWEVMGAETYATAQSQIAAALAGDQVNDEMTMVTPDGQSRDLAVTYIPDINLDGSVKGFFGLINDISDRKATERLKDEFVSVVGHELRTPLTSIHGSLKLLATNRLGQLAPQGREVVDIALNNTERLTRLINDVLDLERIESGRISMVMQECDASALMIQATQAMQAMATDYGVRLSVNAIETTVSADPDHLTQVLTNLLSNAIKFSPCGSTVWFSAVARPTDTLLTVKDQGRGIPPDKLETIFERFQQVDASDSRQRGGTGLGLTICKQIIQQHGGKIWAESKLGQGSTFFLTLPRDEQTKDSVIDA